MMKNKFLYVSVASLSILPLIALAAQARSFSETINYVISIISSFIPVVVTFLFLAFFWGLARFIKARSAGGADKQLEDGKKMMVWSFVGVFVAVSVWGLVGFLMDAFFDTTKINNTAPYPQNLLST